MPSWVACFLRCYLANMSWCSARVLLHCMKVFVACMNGSNCFTTFMKFCTLHSWQIILFACVLLSTYIIILIILNFAIFFFILSIVFNNPSYYFSNFNFSTPIIFLVRLLFYPLSLSVTLKLLPFIQFYIYFGFFAFLFTQGDSKGSSRSCKQYTCHLPQPTCTTCLPNTPARPPPDPRTSTCVHLCP